MLMVMHVNTLKQYHYAQTNIEDRSEEIFAANETLSLLLALDPTLPNSEWIISRVCFVILNL
jgi:hypothetical protein